MTQHILTRRNDINIYGKKKFIENVNDIKMIWNENENKLKREKLLERKLKDYGTTKSAEKIAQKNNCDNLIDHDTLLQLN